MRFLAVIGLLAVLVASPGANAPARAEDGLTVRHVAIRGHVQHVHYRLWAQAKANEAGIEGWVRNRRDGSVEAVFAASSSAVAAMIEACRQGPSGARVDGIEQSAGSLADLAMRRHRDRFSILKTK